MARRDSNGPRVERRLIVAPDAATRFEHAVAWLGSFAPADELLIVAPTWEACDEIARTIVGAAGASFGVQRLTLDRLAGRLASHALAAARRVPAAALSFAAVTARAVHELRAGLRHFGPVAGRPGFPLAVARTLAELRMSGLEAAALARLEAIGGDLAAIAERVERELADAGLADRALVFAAAARAAAADPPPHPVGLPLLLLDLAVASEREAELVGALARRAPRVLATVPAGDEPTARRLAAALRCRALAVERARAPDSLGELQTHLFSDTAPARAALDGSVTLTSSPGEARECIEIARRIQTEAAAGVRFDQMAIFLHAPGEYTVHLEEALRRAAIPAFFARGTTRPHPAGRALLALLACAAERLSAHRFAEYLSLAQVPDPEAAPDADTAWTPPGDDLLARDAEPAAEANDDEDVLRRDPAAAAVIAGTLRAPWRWEELLVEASVIGEEQRWERRLAGLEEEVARRRQAVAEEDEARRAALERTALDLRHLREFALPLIKRLATLPDQASWGVWLAHLRELAVVALRRPVPVLATLAELEPMAPVGPVGLDEVRAVLAERLRDLPVPPPRRRYGAVLVTPAGAGRGLAFDVVFVPGLAEKLFPRKIVEDPILPDAARAGLATRELVTQAERVAAERLALRLAVGAARRRVHLSYPRIDVEQARPRVPSFYALEALRAAEGELPGFEELSVRAGAGAGARLGWPAPPEPAQAIDEAEYDLALLAPLIGGDAAAASGGAHYLLSANPYLGRALRARARRWLPSAWTVADGLVAPAGAPDRPDRAAEHAAYERARLSLARHQLGARSFSATALQHFAACPYRFFLQAIHRLQPREEPVAIETIDPLTRGALVHEVQFAALSALRGEGLLPVEPAHLARALTLADEVLDRVAAAYRDELAPAIDRVWDDGIAAIRADVHEWLRRHAAATDGWVPYRFELSFGIVDRERTDADPTSVPEPVPIVGGLRLRGAIDLVERRADGVLRVTDHKTGRPWTKEGVVVGGGETLQPLLYALAAERLLAEPVASGRLYYCTADGGYAEREVRIDGATRDVAVQVVAVIDGALREGFFPAAPRKAACQACDYRPVCGPLEEVRTARKPAGRLGDLQRLRALP